MLAPCSLKDGAIMMNQAHNCGVMNSDTSTPKYFNDVTIAKAESEIVANGY